MSGQTMPERMTSLETKTEYISKAVDSAQSDIKDVKATVQNLPDQIITKFDDRYALKEMTQNQLDSIKETIEPLSNLRKHMWGALITIVVIVITLIIAAYQFLTSAQK